MSTIKILKRRKIDWKFNNRVYLKRLGYIEDWKNYYNVYVYLLENRFKIKETQSIYSLIDTKLGKEI